MLESINYSLTERIRDQI